MFLTAAYRATSAIDHQGREKALHGGSDDRGGRVRDDTGVLPEIDACSFDHAQKPTSDETTHEHALTIRAVEYKDSKSVLDTRIWLRRLSTGLLVEARSSLIPGS